MLQWLQGRHEKQFNTVTHFTSDSQENNHYPNIWVSIQWGGLRPAAAGGSFLSQSLIVWSSQISRLEQTWVTLRQRHTEGAILYEKKLKPFLKSLNEGKGTLRPRLAV